MYIKAKAKDNLFKNHLYEFIKNDTNIYYKEFCDSSEKKFINLRKKNNNNNLII